MIAMMIITLATTLTPAAKASMTREPYCEDVDWDNNSCPQHCEVRGEDGKYDYCDYDKCEKDCPEEGRPNSLVPSDLERETISAELDTGLEPPPDIIICSDVNANGCWDGCEGIIRTEEPDEEGGLNGVCDMECNAAYEERCALPDDGGCNSAGGKSGAAGLTLALVLAGLFGRRREWGVALS